MKKLDVTAVLVCLTLAVHARADIYRWDTGEVILGTEGVEPGPGVQLSGIDLDHADLRGFDLSNSSLYGTNLANATLRGANLTGTNFSRGGPIGRSFAPPRIYRTDFTDAIINGADLSFVTYGGFTMDDLRQTASYRNRDLSNTIWGGRRAENDLSGWDFSDQNLRGAVFGEVSDSGTSRINLARANFQRANLSSGFALLRH